MRCSPSEYDEEMAFFQVGANPLNTASMTATWPTAADPWRGLCNPAFFTNVNPTITGGGTFYLCPQRHITGECQRSDHNGYACEQNMSFANLSVPFMYYSNAPAIHRVTLEIILLLLASKPLH